MYGTEQHFDRTSATNSSSDYWNVYLGVRPLRRVTVCFLCTLEILLLTYSHLLCFVFTDNSDARVAVYQNARRFCRTLLMRCIASTRTSRTTVCGWPKSTSSWVDTMIWPLTPPVWTSLNADRLQSLWRFVHYEWIYVIYWSSIFIFIFLSADSLLHPTSN